MAYKGKFVPTNPHKYRGNINDITYRSLWENFFMKYCDTNPDIVSWGSETTVIPYFSVADGKNRRYFMDFWMRDKSGQEWFIEVKPAKETVPPIRPSKLTASSKQKYLNELYTYSVNQDKWKATQKVADARNIKFKILTEKGLKRLGYKGLTK